MPGMRIQLCKTGAGAWCMLWWRGTLHFPNTLRHTAPRQLVLTPLLHLLPQVGQHTAGGGASCGSYSCVQLAGAGAKLSWRFSFQEQH